MADRLVWLLRHFELRAHVFQAGRMDHVARFRAADGLGYIHVLERGVLEIEGERHDRRLLTEPSLFVYINPTDHRLTPRDDAVKMVCATFEFGAGMCNPVRRALPDLLCIGLADMPMLEQTLALLFREAFEDHCGRQAILDRLIEVVIVQVLRDLMDEERLEFGLLAALADPRLAKAINAMHAEPAGNWTLVGLAKTAGMSRARFAARFREVVGLTPMAYLTEWRIGMAQSLLKQGKPVQFVADVAGFSSASAFSRAFRARTGQTPTTWVRRLSAG
jgi:AraC-like DNA-binding protein